MVNVERKPGRPAGQIVLIDTPGIHKPINSLNRRMMKEVYDALEGCNLLLLIVDATARFGPGDQFVLELAKKTGLPVFLLLNKVDAIDKQKLLPMIAQYKELHDFAEVIPISALKRQGLDTLLDSVIKALPEGPRYFPKDQITDQPERFLAAELIREQVLMNTSQEVPHATTVLIDQYEEGEKADAHRGDYLRRARGAEGHPDRQAGRDAKEDRHCRAAANRAPAQPARFPRAVREGATQLARVADIRRRNRLAASTGKARRVVTKILRAKPAMHRTRKSPADGHRRIVVPKPSPFNARARHSTGARSLRLPRSTAGNKHLLISMFAAPLLALDGVRESLWLM